MSCKVKMLTLGLVQTNCFIIGDEASKTAVLVDAPDNAPLILEALAQDGWQLSAILLTHAHWDHVRAVRGVKEATNAPIYLHADDLPLLAQMPEQIRLWTGETELPAPSPDQLVQHGQRLTFPACALEVRHTPGHTPGHVSYVWHEGAVVFSGDCLFEGSVGRTDFPNSDHNTLMGSIFKQLLSLPEDYTVACGHGRTTTIARERQSNPFILDWQARFGGSR
jgi:glyoxylase-like metal-dependent hydrolase (beta-lactamase superfamily II)